MLRFLLINSDFGGLVFVCFSLAVTFTTTYHWVGLSWLWRALQHLAVEMLNV